MKQRPPSKILPRKHPTRRPRPSIHEERGVVLVLMALLAVALLSFAVLGIGIGFLASERSRLQTIGNIAALSAIDQYIRLPSDDHTESVRRAQAVERANFILSKNKLAGAADPLGDLGNQADGDGGKVVFGKFFREDPGTSPCTEYPCFVQVNESTPANAVMAVVKNQDDNPIVRPLGGIIGKEEFQLETTAFATLVNSCVGHLLDVSVSVVNNVHTPFYPSFCPQNKSCNDCDGKRCYWANTRLLIKEPIVVASDGTDTYNFSTASLFAFDTAKIFVDPTDPSAGMKDCTDETALTENSPDLVYWCNMYPSRADWETKYNSGAPAPDGMFFRSDYELQRVFKGQRIIGDEDRSIMLVAKRPDQPPFPMLNFFLGANMALRIGEKLPSESNQGFFWAFTGDILNRAEPPIIDDDGNDRLQLGGNALKELVTNDLAYLTQLTHMGYIGGTDAAGLPSAVAGDAKTHGNPDGNQIHPNLLDAGFFPMDSPHVAADSDPIYAAANIPLVLYQAARVLNTACDISTRRSIFLYTDGIGTCEFIPQGITGESAVSASCALVDGSPWDNYVMNEYAILKVLIPYLQEVGIPVTVFFDGISVSPNFYNREDPNHRDSVAQGGSGCSASDDPGCFLDFSRAGSAGFQGVPAPSGRSESDMVERCADGDTSLSMFDCQSKDSDENWAETLEMHKKAFHELVVGKDAIFGRAVGVMGELAMKTGGTFCPLMSPGAVADYVDHDEDYQPGGKCGAADEAACCQRIFDGHSEAQGATPCRLKNSARTVGAKEVRSLEFVPKGFQAALCAQRSLELNPFIMVHPFEVQLLTP